MKLRIVLAAVAASALSGCAAIETRETQAWLALHVIDTAQTYRIASDRCFHEADQITSAIIGDGPSRSEVIAWSIGDAAFHVGVTELLLRTDHPRLAKAWQYLRIGTVASAIAQNHSIGIRIGSPNQPKPGTCSQEPAQAPTQNPGPIRPIG